MPPKRQFRPPKTEAQEKKDLEDCIPKASRNATKWAFKVLSELQISRNNKDPSQEHCSFKVDLAKIQSLDLNITNKNVELLVDEVCSGGCEGRPELLPRKEFEQHYDWPARSLEH